MNEDTRRLISCVANNNLKQAKKYAEVLANADKTEKNRRWKDRVIKTLSQKDDALQLPDKLQQMCQLYDAQKQFCAERFYLSIRDKKIVDEILTRQKLYERMNRLGITAHNSCLFYGEPGVGKTELAKYISWRMEKPLLTIRFSMLIESLMGKTGRNISEIFRFFRENDCILFIDEMDLIASTRESGTGANKELTAVTISLMQELDEMKEGACILAATNRIKDIDQAVLRRFQKIHEMLCPSREDCEQMAKLFWDSLRIEPSSVLSKEELSIVNQKQTASELQKKLICLLETYLRRTPEPTPLETRKTEADL